MTIITYRKFIKKIPCAAPPLLEICRQRITRPPLHSPFYPQAANVCARGCLPSADNLQHFSRSSQRKTMKTNGHRGGACTLKLLCTSQQICNDNKESKISRLSCASRLAATLPAIIQQNSSNKNPDETGHNFCAQLRYCGKISHMTHQLQTHTQTHTHTKVCV